MGLTLLATWTPAHAQSDRPRTSIFAYAYRGFAAGTLAGLGAGYLAVRDDGVRDQEWRGLVFGAGVGALALAGTAVAFGLMDMDDAGPPIAHYVTRDALYGVAFGALAGAATGGLVVLADSDNKAEHIVAGAAIGSLVGLGVGVTVGALTGLSAAPRAPGWDRHHRRRPRVDITVTMAPTPGGNYAFGPAMYGQF